MIVLDLGVQGYVSVELLRYGQQLGGTTQNQREDCSISPKVAVMIWG